MRVLTLGFLFSLAAGFAQNTPVTCSSTTCTYTLSFGDGAESRFVLTDAPYSGQHEIKSSEGMLPPQPMIYRDSQGRARIERRISLSHNLSANKKASEALFIEITDPVAGNRYILDPVLSVAHRTPYHPQGSNTVSSPTFDEKRSETTDFQGNTTVREFLGPMEISGVSTLGYRIVRRAPATASGGEGVTLSYSEVWIDPKTSIYVLSKSSGSAGTMNENRVAGYNNAEPDPALFRVPDGYKIVDETGLFDAVHPYHGEPGTNGLPRVQVTGPMLSENCDDKACTLSFAPGNGRDPSVVTGAHENRSGTIQPTTFSRASERCSGAVGDAY